MVYYVTVLVSCLAFIIGSAALKKVPNETVIRVFNSNLYRKIGPEPYSRSVASVGKRAHLIKSPWVSNTFGDPYFDGYLNHHQQPDKVGLFQAIKHLLMGKSAPVTEDYLSCSNLVSSNVTTGKLDMKSKVTSGKNLDIAVTSKVKHMQNTAAPTTALPDLKPINRLLAVLENASTHLESIAQKMEEELNCFYRIREGMEKSVCYHKGVGSSKEKKLSWGEWSPWSACSVTCGVGTQIRDRLAVYPERGRPSIEVEVKPCRLPDCNPTLLLFNTANNFFRGIIPTNHSNLQTHN